MKSRFQQIWKTKLSSSELKSLQSKIESMRERGVPYKRVVESIPNKGGKLKEDWKKERVVRTEEKKLESEDIKESGATKYRIELSINPCNLCKEVAKVKVYTKKTLVYKGRGIPPVHPQCECSLIPIE